MQTFAEADVAGDGHISSQEWQQLVQRSPDIISYMTLPVLKQVLHSLESPVIVNRCFKRRGHCWQDSSGLRDIMENSQ